jgi:hypothetical protein
VYTASKTSSHDIFKEVLMPNEKPSFADALQFREGALSRWDNEGEAGRQGPQESAIGGHTEPGDAPRLGIDLLQRAGCFRTGDVKQPSLAPEEGRDD